MTRKLVLSGSVAAIVAGAAALHPNIAGARPPAAAGAISPLVAASERPLEPAAGAPVRSHRATTDRAPAAARAAWRQFQADHGQWQAIWDARTGVPLRVWGEGIPAPGAIASPDRALDAARAIVGARLELFAPGVKAADLVVVANVVHGGLHGQPAMRTVGFAQTWNGVPVIGGQLSVLFKQDRAIVIGSEVIPDVAAALPATIVGAGVAEARAVGWIAQLTGAPARARAVDVGVRLLPLVRERARGVELVAVVSAEIELIAPAGPGRWQVYLDAGSGQPVARATRLRFADGVITYRVPTRSPQGQRMDAPVPNTNFRIGAQTVLSDAAGRLTWAGTASAQVTTALTGPRVAITNGLGAVASTTLTLAPGGTASWDRSTVAADDAQLATYVFAHTVKTYAKTNLAPGLAYLDARLSATVNESGSCNAYSTGDDIHFFRANSQCENTGRLADVVYHEFGHSLHDQSIIPGAGSFDGALSEGASDYLAATITNDHGMGRGFFFNNEALRDLDPVGSEKRWPDDVQGEVHADGEIIGGTLWDVRAAMIAAHGAATGVAKADDIYYALLQRSSDIPSTYAEALAADDDDGNLANGTPNLCLLRDVFARHGLASGDGATGLGVGAPVRTGFQIAVPILAPTGGCAVPTIGAATLSWRLRGQTAATTVTLTRQGDALVGAIPPQADGTVVQYQVSVVANGNPVRYPDNLADPMYEFFIGEVTPIYCTNFETDPGWTHGATAGADDWQRGVSSGAGGDPAAGTQVWGNDLGAEGSYEAGVALWTRSPMIDTSGFTDVRLQYRRWLNVEDGFFDDATVTADGATVWRNFDSNMGNNSSTSHTDKEWRFHDVDLSAQAADGAVQIGFTLASDGGLELGGWTIDELCVVGHRAGAAACGNGAVEAGEQCDDGNTAPGDGCSATCQHETPPPGCGDGTLGAGEQCDDGNTAPGDGCSSTCQIEIAGPDAGSDGGIDNPDDGDPSGGCCSTGGGGGAAAGGLALAVGALIGRRRRRR